MRARARIVAAPDGRGGTRLAVLHGEPPLVLRRTGPVTVHLVGGAAGPLGGDDLRLTIEVQAGAELTVRSVAAHLALPGPAGAPASRLEISATVGPGATLRWRPEPLIAAAGCDHRAVTRVAVADGGRLLWRDDLACGRHGEPSGSVRTSITVEYAGRTVYRHDLTVGPRAPGWSSAAVFGAARAYGSLLALPGMAEPGPAGDAVDTMPGGGMVAAMPLAGPRPGGGMVAGPGMVVTALGADIRAVRAALDPLDLTPVAEADGAGSHPVGR